MQQLRYSLLLVLMAFIAVCGWAQTPTNATAQVTEVTADVRDNDLGSFEPFEVVPLASKDVLTADAGRSIGLSLKVEVLERLRRERLHSWNWSLPEVWGESPLHWEGFVLNAPVITVGTTHGADGATTREAYAPQLIAYRLVAPGCSGTLVLLADGFVGRFNVQGVDYELGLTGSESEVLYTLFDVGDALETSSFSCAVDDHEVAIMGLQPATGHAPEGTPCVQVALDLDAFTVSQFPSTYEAVEWALVTLAAVDEVYLTELENAVTLNADYVHVWEGSDPYEGFVGQAGDMLDAVRDEWATNADLASIDRDIVHLMTMRTNTGTGGIAYLGTGCDDYSHVGFSQGMTGETTYTAGTYAWNVHVVAHELGHNFGAQHTHWCGWNGGPINNCAALEGGVLCAPYVNAPQAEVGTIMSYCHAIYGGSVTLNFHPVVKAEALVPFFDAAECFGACNTFATNAAAYGCTDAAACNYDEVAYVDDGTCAYASDSCGVCGGDNSSCSGCTDDAACNFDASAILDDGSCVSPVPGYECDCTTDMSGVMQVGGFQGAQLGLYASGALNSVDIVIQWTNPNGAANAASDVLVKWDSPDGQCVQVGGYSGSIPGCSFIPGMAWPASWNSSASGEYTATLDLTPAGLTGTGAWYVSVYNGRSPSNAVGYDFTAVLHGVCSGAVVAGCTDELACNFNSGATYNPLDECAYAVTACESCSGETDGSGTVLNDGQDTDEDGTPDCEDGCPFDAGKVESGACGCGTADTDSDADGLLDCNDACSDLTACNYASEANAECTWTPIPTALVASATGCTGGYAATISGSNLCNVVEVRVNGAEAPLVAVSNTEVTFTVPAGVGTASVDVVNSLGEVVSAGSFYYASPILMSLSVNAVSCTGGTLVSAYGMNLCGATVLVDGDSLAATSASATSIAFIAPSGSGSFTVAVSAGGFVSNSLLINYLPPVIEQVLGGPFGCVGGETMVLSGHDFCELVVHIGGEEALILGQTDSTVSVQVPPAMGASVPSTMGSPQGPIDFFTVYAAPSLIQIQGTASCAGGEQITLNGTNLCGASVTVGGEAVALNASSATSVTFVAPAGSGSQVVQVVATTGTSNVLTLEYLGGCMDPDACNYDAAVGCDDGSCAYPGDCEICSGASDGTGTVEPVALAVNFVFPLNGLSCQGGDDVEVEGTGFCNVASVLVNTVPVELAYASDGLLVFPMPEGTGNASLSFVLLGGDTLAVESLAYAASGCMDPDACNYDAAVGCDDGSCAYPGDCEICSGASDGTGTVEPVALAVNFVFPLNGLSCQGGDDVEVEGTGFCNVASVLVNTEPVELAYASDGLLVFPMPEGTGNASLSFVLLGGDTLAVESLAYAASGCMDPDACNYDAAVGCDDGSCAYPGDCEICSGASDGTGTVEPVALAVNFVFPLNGLSCQGGDDVEVEGTGFCNVASVLVNTEPVELAYASDGLLVFPMPEGTGNASLSFVLLGGDTLAVESLAYAASGCMDPDACNYDAAVGCDDGSCAYPGDCEICSGASDGTGTVVNNDADNDGVCDADEIEGCVDPLACNYDATATTDANNALCVYPIGCESCSGAQDGTGTVVDNDADNDGVCDADEIEGCVDPLACNYDATATTDANNALCVYPIGCESCSGAQDGTGTVVDNDADNDGVCDAEEIEGCADPLACNYDATATTDADNALCTYATGCDACSGAQDGTGTVVENDADNDGVCDAEEIEGCVDPLACNYDATATTDADNALCTYATGCDACSGAQDGTGTVVDNDADNDGVCDAEEIEGCVDPLACNYDATATTDADNALCTYATGCDECSGAQDGTGTVVDNDADNDGVCDANEIEGCRDASACNYDATATTDANNALCVYPIGCESCSGAQDGTGTVVDHDADNDGVCDAEEIEGCVDPLACNYDATATTDADNALCTYATGCDACSGAQDGTGTVVDNDADNDGVCDADEIEGCVDPLACNYDATATTDADNALCTYATGCESCSGAQDGTGTVVENDADNDGVCDAEEIEGCVDPLACNYDATATTDADNALCTYATGCDACSGAQDGTGTVVDNDADNDGVCDADEIEGCRDASACNYDATATTDANNALCVYPIGCESCSGAQDGTGTVVDNDADNDGVCDAEEIEGCADPLACNYDATATTDADNALCTYATGCDACSGAQDGTGTVVDNDADNDGVCDADEIEGCVDPLACNYDATATTDADNALCTYATGCDACSGAQDGTGTVVDNDADNDGVCDADEIEGCVDPLACNYDATATTDADNALCTYATGCDECSGAQDGTGTVVDNDADNDGVCDAEEIEGCADPLACNYDATATTDADNALCTYATGCESCSGAQDGTGTVVDNDADNDGVCDAEEIEGCVDPLACNYDATATTDADNALCTYATGCDACSGAQDGTGTVVDNDADNDGVCDSDEIEGCQDNTACNFNAAATNATTCTYPASGEDCAGNCLNDSDNDGVCDEIENAGCTDPTACNYNEFAGQDDSSCEFTSCAGCMVPTACNYDADATASNAQSCVFAGGCDTCSGETDGTGTVVDNDTDNDGVCNADEVLGCTVANACNYSPEATDDNGLCEFASCAGCTLAIACNYDAAATLGNNGTCVFPDGCSTCSGETDGTGTMIPNDDDEDGVCNDDEVLGCTDPTACDFNAAATNSGDCDYVSCVGCLNPVACNYAADATQSGDCTFPAAFSTCAGCINDANNNQVCDELEEEGCIDPTATNFDPSADLDDGSCIAVVLGCMLPWAPYYDATATQQAVPVLDACYLAGPPTLVPGISGVPPTSCSDFTACNYAPGGDPSLPCDYSCYGCTNIAACDYDPAAFIPTGCTDYTSCVGCTDSSACNYEADNTQDDGSCEYTTCAGCTNSAACNYDATATINVAASCIVPTGCDTCSGGAIVDNDSDNDGVCDADEVDGCMNSGACNYDINATDSDGSCEFSTCVGCMDNTACNYDSSALISDAPSCTFTSGVCDVCSGETDGTGTVVDNDTDNDGVCNADEIAGCTNSGACNYNPAATDSDSSCEFVSCVGCMDNTACNYDSNALIDAPGTCTYATGCDTCSGATDGTGTVVDGDSDNDSVCDADEVTGCMTAGACNYNPAATDAATCDFTSCEGCTDSDACNYDAAATISDASCTYPPTGYEDCDGLVCTDINNNSVCDVEEPAAPGCTHPAACNYDPAANADDGSCDEVLIGSVAIEAASAAGARDGALAPNITGGTPPYAVFLMPEGIALPEALWNALAPGLYYLEAEDATGCRSGVPLRVLLPHVQCDTLN